MRYDFLVVGSALVDVIVETRSLERQDVSGKYAEYVLHFSSASKSLVNGLSVSPGGSALNVAVTMDCMGSRVAFLTSIGKSVFGDFILDKLRSTGINASFVRRADSQTGVGINLVSGHEKSALVYHGAVDELSVKHVTPSMIMNSRHVLITSLTSDKNFPLFMRILKLAKDNKVPVVFAPGITMLRKFERRLRNLKYYFDIIILNYEEGSFLTEQKDVRSILRRLPGRIAVVTKDRDGAYAREGSRFMHVDSLKVRVRNTTGAGDVFCGAFVHTFYDTGSINEALKIAAVVSSMKLSRMEAEVQCFPPEILKFLKAYEKRIRVREL
ncbi:carbohydrate kinase family protein [Candidatus Woesearchaeota archaeon]|nr:carbohydrate kinase family protein [Candidatus Woesearchaeota archaeon]